MNMVHWPPGVDLKSVWQVFDYQVAAGCFSLNMALAALAMFFGGAFLEVVLRFSDKCHSIRLNVTEVIFLSLGLGLALIIAETFFLALLGLLYIEAVGIAFAITFLIASALLARKKTELSQLMVMPCLSWKSTTSVIFILLLLLYQYSSAMPISIGDATSYHAVYADFFVKNHGLGVDYNLIYPYHVFNINLLFSLALMFKHDLVYLQTVHALFTTLTMLGIYVGCLRFGKRLWVAVLLPFIFAQIYVIKSVSQSALVDLGSMFFIFSAIFTLLLWSGHRRATWLLIVSAVYFGIAMGSKYFMCVFVAPIVIFIILIKRKHAFKPLMIYGVTAGIWGLWWYARNFLLAGNPVHPFAPEIFGYYLWDEFDVWDLMGTLRTGFMPPSLMSFLFAPFYAHGSQGLVEQHVFYILAALYLFAPLLFFSEKSARFIPLFCFFYVYCWINGTQDPRYMMPAMPLIFLFVGSVYNGMADWILEKANKFSPAVEKSNIFLRGFLAILMLGYAGFFVQQKFTNLFYMQLDPQKTRESLIQYFPDYDLVDKANAEFDENETIFEFGYRNIRWFYKGNMLGTQGGVNGYFRVLGRAVRDGVPGYSAEKLETVLRSQYNADGFIIPNPPYYLYSQEEFDHRFQLVYRNKEGSVYRLRKNSPEKPTEASVQ